MIQRQQSRFLGHLMTGRTLGIKNNFARNLLPFWHLRGRYDVIKLTSEGLKRGDADRIGSDQTERFGGKSPVIW